MPEIRLSVGADAPPTLVLPVAGERTAAADGARSRLLAGANGLISAELLAEVDAFIRDAEHSGAAGVVHTLPRPTRTPERVLAVGVGTGDEAGWRGAGAALTRAARRQDSVTIALPPGTASAAVRGLAEGALMAGYRFRLAGDTEPEGPKLRTIAIAVDQTGPYRDALHAAQVTAGATSLARDLTNMPSEEKTPAWFAGRIQAAADDLAVPGLTVDVRDQERLAREGFGGILAVGGGSQRGPRLLEVRWRPPTAGLRVVLVGKGITFDTGGICIKSRDGMKLMRKDMGGAAAVVATALAAAELGLGVEVTALAPLAENMVSGSAYRPGDVVRHYGGRTTEVLNTDAEGRVVLADALSYAVRQLHPDLLVDLATLTGAQSVALGKGTAALYSESESLVEALSRAARAAGERVWRMPLIDEYADALRSEVADVVNSTDVGAGSVMAALYLREFTGEARDRWAHLDMSAPAWSDSADLELPKGATGWGVRTLVRWLEGLAAQTGRPGQAGPGSAPA